jgi:phage tail-like protein
LLTQNKQGSTTLESRYVEFLPGVLREDEFIKRFLLIFESILGPIENTVDNIPQYIDPLMTPEPLLPWLASWVDLALDSSCPLERRRELVKSAAELYRWRGTRRGLSEFLRIYTGSKPEISEYIPGMRLEEGTRLGINTKLGSSGEGHHFTVTIALNGDSELDASKLRSIVDAQKPAHTIYTLQINRNV